MLAFVDADGSVPPASVADVIEPIRTGTADLSVGSRRHPDATVETHQTVVRRYMGDSFAWLARRLLDEQLSDYQCEAKVITAAGWEMVREHLYEAGFAWDVELIAIAGALDLHIEEVPIKWHDRPGSTVSPIRTPLSLGRALVTTRHRSKRLSDGRLLMFSINWEIGLTVINVPVMC